MITMFPYYILKKIFLPLITQLVTSPGKLYDLFKINNKHLLCCIVLFTIGVWRALSVNFMCRFLLSGGGGGWCIDEWIYHLLGWICAWKKLLSCVYSGLLLIMWPSSDHLPKVAWITRCSKHLTSSFHFESSLCSWYLITVWLTLMKCGSEI